MQEQVEEQTPSSEEQGATALIESERCLSPWWVLGGIFTLSTILALIAHRSLIYSVGSIKSSIARMKEEGRTLSPEQCAGRVLKWVQKCDAMQSLCDASVHRLMGRCLEGRSREQACKKMDLMRSKAHFTFARCKKRKLPHNRRWKKICGGVYSTLWIHCMYWKKGKIHLPRKRPVPQL